MDLEQIFRVLKQGAPGLNNDMTNMFSGKIYPNDYPEIINSISKGYDPGLMEARFNEISSRFYDPETGEPATHGLSPSDLVDYEYYVPGELNPYAHRMLKDSTDNPLGGGAFAYRNPFPSDDIELLQNSENSAPAYDSAQQFITGGVPRIGNSDYTIDDLRRNGMSEPDILALIRRLANQGYEI